MILLFLIGFFEWYAIPGGVKEADIYAKIINSSEGSHIISENGGVGNLLNGIIPIDGRIFEGGMKLLLPEKYKIIRTPQNIKILKRNIKVKGFKRYSVIYTQGDLIKEWRELKEKSMHKMGLSDSENISRKDLTPLLPENEHLSQEKIIKNDIEKIEITTPVNDMGKSKILPERKYYSFLLLGEKESVKIIPVVLNLSPVDDFLNKIREGEAGGEDEV